VVRVTPRAGAATTSASHGAGVLSVRVSGAHAGTNARRIAIEAE